MFNPLDNLNSERPGISYTPLNNLLTQGDWERSNAMTDQLICRVAGCENRGWLAPEPMQQFPRRDLHIIDALWLHHSNGQFGFSVQRDIWQRFGGFRDCPPVRISADQKDPWRPAQNWWEQYKSFATELGWCRNKLWWVGYPNGLTYDISAPPGHLPGFCYASGAHVIEGLNQDQTGWSGWQLLARLV
jgi:hypothetical protein